MQAKALSLFLLMSLSAAINSCTFFRQVVGLNVTKPTVILLDINVEKEEREFLHMNIRLTVHNPNDFAVTLSDIRYFIRLNEQDTGDGHYREKITFPEFGDKEVSIPLRLSLKNSIGILQKVLFRHQSQLKVKWNALLQFHSQVGPIQLEVTDEKKLL